MKIGLFSVFSHRACTLKDVAGGYGTVFNVGHSWRAKLLNHAKKRLIHLPPPALGYLAALAHTHGHQVIVNELRRDSRSKEVPPPVDLAIVLSSITDAPEERRVLQELKEQGIACLVIGAFASAQPDYYKDCASAVITGEAEALGAALFDRKLRGIVHAGEIKTLSTLPFPNWEAFPRDQYRYAGLASKGFVLPVLGMRGCAYRCNYCPYPATASYRLRPVSHVVEEIRYLKQHYHIKGVAFRDPLFNASRARLDALIEQLTPLDIHYSAEMRIEHLNPPLLDHLYRSGLRSLQVGVESADPSFVQSLNRAPASLEHIRTIVRHAEKIGIRVIANFVLGLPSDSEVRMNQSVEFAKELNSFAVQFTLATPYPKTPLRNEVKSLLEQDAGMDFSGWNPTFRHPEMSAPALKSMREKAYLQYHFRLRYLTHLLSFPARALKRKLVRLFQEGLGLHTRQAALELENK